MEAVKDFITATAVKYFSFVEKALDPNKDDKHLNKFIEETHCLILCAYPDKNIVQYTTDVSSESKMGSLVFYKKLPTALETIENLQHLSITAVQNNPFESLYLSLKHIYGPLLLSNNSVKLDPKFQEMVGQLESSLQLLVHGSDENPSLIVVLSIEDELHYWKAILKESHSQKQKDMAKTFETVLHSIAEEMGTIDNSEVSEVSESMENVGGLLDDLWRHSIYPYPQKRMSHLLDIIGNKYVLRLQDILDALNLWGNDTSIVSKISECDDVVLGWLKICSNLTKKYWPNHSLHVWEGPPHEAQYVKMFHSRVKEIVDIRSIHQQLTKLLMPSEQQELNMSKMFQPFNGINIWKNLLQKNSTWTKAKLQFEKNVKPAENKIAEKLKSLLVNISQNQMVYEFIKYSTLIERPLIFANLSKERQILLGTIEQVLKEIENQTGTEKNKDNSLHTVPEVSPLIQQIQWTKRMDGRVTEIEKLVKCILNDLEGSKEILIKANLIKKNVLALQANLYEDWTQTLQIELNNKNIMLAPDTPVVEFSGENNFMRVTFNPQLFSLERDIRHVTALGFAVPTNIREAVMHSSQFMEQARSLQHVASFHNTLGERMIPSQRPMMLNAAVQLASLVKEQTAVTWKSVDSVSKYVEKLMTAVENLSKQNAFLSSQHAQMRNIVLSLMDTNLLQKQSDWKKSIRQMREIIEKVEVNGYVHTKAWVNHWDIQLYKALEHQYRTILIDPLSYLPTIKAELIFRQQTVQLQPAMEDLRSITHSCIKKLITLPAHFVGLQPQYDKNETVFSTIISRNSWLVAGAMLEIETTLKKVLDAVQKWKIWAALGSVDLDGLCEIHLSHPTDWDNNFKECKSFGQSIAKLPMDDEQIGWISISCSTLRNDLESHNRRYWLALTTSLQSSVQQDSLILESYILSIQNMMDKSTPKTAQELSSSNAEFYKLKESEAQMTVLYDNLKQKQKMIRAWSGERMMSMDYLAKKWDGVLNTIQNHEKLIAHRTETIKSTILNDWENLMTSVDAWFSKWKQNKPRLDQLTNISFVEMQAKYKSYEEANDTWQKHYSKINEILNECENFRIKIDEQSLWKNVEKKMNDDAVFWKPLQDFKEELRELGDQEWIVFQKKMYLLDDLVTNWKSKTEPVTPVTLTIQKEIDKYKDILPFMKYLKSTDYTEKHWREIYSLLEIPMKPSDNLCLNDFLAVAENIKSNSKSLQKISLDASQEAVIREAVAELELWLAGARLTMVKHKDNKGQTVPIIKDFKDTLAKVEEYQNLAGSARSANNVKDGNSSDQLSIWESRLSHIKIILSALAHVQRK